MIKTFEKYILEIMSRNDKVLFISADTDFKYYDEIKERFPDRYFNFGIAEGNTVDAAVGLAKDGFIPVVYAVAAFLVYRANEQIRDFMSLQNANVKLVGVGAGLKINNLGPTHHATEDIAFMRVLPNMTLISPASPYEVVPIMDAAIEHKGPVYVRLGKAFEEEIYDTYPEFSIGV
ncbi:MAG: hypothetical protein LBE72_01085, partial [Rickettsia sp.]|nr:hypothetical protein [Rickettsia sp.]